MITLLLGLIVSLAGALVLFGKEKCISNVRDRQAWGYGICGFGLAHALLGGVAVAIGRKR